MVQPFARDFEQRGQVVHLVMHAMESNHFAVTARAEEMSADCIDWRPIPDPINVIGSRFALVIKNLQTVEFELPLAHTQVAAGNQRGRRGDEYIRGRVDKAVLEVVEEATVPYDEEESYSIELAAELAEPHAVFVRTR